jgi:hypothetical protein
LTTNLFGHCVLIHAKSSNVTVGSNMVSRYSATVPGQRSSDANDSGSVVSRSNHQRRCGMASSTVRSVNVGGIDMPLRVSRNRAPATGTSTVTSMVSNLA